jgi:hypothetical protein
MLKKILMAGGVALSLAGCSATGGLNFSGVGAAISAGASNVQSTLLSINTTLAAAAPSVEALVADAQVALGYANQLQAAGLIPKASSTKLAQAAAVVNAIANNPPSSVASVVGALAAAKTNIQNLSAVPAAVAVTVPVVAIPASPVTGAVPAATVVVPAAQ